MKKASFFLFLSTFLTNSYGQKTVESHFGVHIGNLTHTSAAPYVDSLKAPQIYVRGDVRADEFGWYFVKSPGQTPICLSNRDTSRCPSTTCDCSPYSYYYSKPASRTPLPSIPQSNPLVSIKINRYDNTIPIQPSDLVGDYPNGHETEFTEYVNFLLQGYRSKAKYWVVGNENEAASFWVGTQQEYSDVVALSSGVIRSNCTDCKVGISFAHPQIAKGTASQKHLWYSTLATVRGTFDFVDAHYYSPAFIQPKQLDSLRFYFPGKEIISTETGIPDTFMTNWGAGMPMQNAGGTPVKQARDLVKYNTLLFDEGYNKLYWYLIDVDYGMGEIFKHNALVNENGSKKPAFYSYKTMISKVDSFAAITKLATGQYRYDFANKGPVYVLWCDTGTCSLPSGISGIVSVTDYMGSARTMQASQIVLDSLPIYVELGTGVSLIKESNSSQNYLSIYPNPFNLTTTIGYQLPTSSLVVLKVYDILGREVETLVNERQSAGIHSVRFNTTNLLGGVYFYRLEAGPYHDAKKLLLVR